MPQTIQIPHGASIDAEAQGVPIPHGADVEGIGSTDKPWYSRAWDWANKGLVSADTITNVTSLGRPSPKKTGSSFDQKPGESAADYINRIKDLPPTQYDMDHPLITALARGSAGAADDLAKVESGFTSPLSIALMATGPLSKLAQSAKMLWAARALKATQAASGAYIGASGVQQAATPQQPGESEADALQRRLLGGAGAVGGSAMAAEPVTAAVKTAGPPVIRGTAKVVNAAIAKSPEIIGTAVGGATGGVAGELVGHPGTGAYLGAKVGASIGKQIPAPTFRVPGEHFGLPKGSTVEIPSTPFGAGASSTEPHPFGAGVKSPARTLFERSQAAPVEAAEPQTAAGAETEEGRLPGAGEGIPRTLSGDSALRQILTGQDNANLLKIAKSRGIDVTAEANLRPGVADSKLINKIIDDHSPEELDNIRDSYLESRRMGGHQFGDIGAEAWKTKSLQTYFPDVKISKAALARTEAAVSQVKSPEQILFENRKQPATAAFPEMVHEPVADAGLAETLKASVEQAQKAKASKSNTFSQYPPELQSLAESESYGDTIKRLEGEADKFDAQGNIKRARDLRRQAMEYRTMKAEHDQQHGIR